MVKGNQPKIELFILLSCLSFKINELCVVANLYQQIINKMKLNDTAEFYSFL